MMEIQKTNRQTALTLGLMSAQLTQLFTELKQEEAKLTFKSYKEQTKIAMYEIIGATVSIGVAVTNLATTCPL